MIGAGAKWRRPTSGMPPWLGAIVTVAAFMLMINSLPMIASAITPDRATFVPTAGPPEPIPLGAAAAGAAAAAGTSTTRSGEEGSGAEQPAAVGAQVPRKPLPVSGGNTLPTLALGGVLLAGGLGLLMMVGFTGEGPWPGRYVRIG
ncbi:hypothetical protein [Sporichthya sp.]|uniref:hypothetical protein n=1 Tax=Sporichthya sp. TaxID=65475 RepID=UPI0017910633|nr:hypothetical protein [Sporichthya sp.]MBA3742178.1 hypothetical protein [Sporichthya sp.]